MLVIPQGNWLYKQLIALSFWQRIVLTIVLLSITFFGWLFGIYLPLAGTITKYKQQIITTSAHSKEITALQEQCHTLEATIATAQSELTNNLAAAKGSSQLLPTLAQQAKKCGFCLDACTVEHNNQNVDTSSTILEGHGTLAQLVTFLGNCCTAHPLLMVENLTINLIKNNTYHATAKFSLSKEA